MRIIMAGIDHNSASVDKREPFSLTTGKINELLSNIKNHDKINGCVLISTCNRTELYLSCGADKNPDPAKLLCEKLGLSEDYCALFTTRSGEDAISHLMMLSAGLRSQIRGEDQVLAQVKTAIDTAREIRAADAVLETLFRFAVSAGKKVKTEVPLSPVETSAASRALDVLREQCGSLKGKQALVIGNGEMGRLSAAMLVAEGCRVTMTLRAYKRGIAVIPSGCGTIAYDERYELISQCDIVISATTSPHFTLRAKDLQNAPRLPEYFIDLAVPRDIDPDIARLPRVSCWNIDTLGCGAASEETADKLSAIENIIAEFTARFHKWQSYRTMLPVAEKRKQYATLGG